MRLVELSPFSKTEKAMIEMLKTEEEAVVAILERRRFLRDNAEYTAILCKEQYKGRFQYRNEKETATMPILYEEDN
jgi:hypothetical protein